MIKSFTLKDVGIRFNMEVTKLKEKDINVLKKPQKNPWFLFLLKFSIKNENTASSYSLTCLIS